MKIDERKSNEQFKKKLSDPDSEVEFVPYYPERLKDIPAELLALYHVRKSSYRSPF